MNIFNSKLTIWIFLIYLCLIFQIAFGQSINPAPYCYPAATGMYKGSCTGFGGKYGYGFCIVSLKVNNLYKKDSCHSSAYRYWNNTSTILNAGETYTMEILSPMSAPRSVSAGAWIDYNKNNVFDSSELLGANFASSNHVNGGIKHKFTFTVPCGPKSTTNTIKGESARWDIG